MKIVILGMHRSGTSLACGLLNIAGVYFGKKNDIIQTNDENPKGFWERKDVRKLNDMLLHQMDCDWSEISNLHQITIPKSILENFKSDAKNIIGKLRQQSNSAAIGIKEPRLCLLMPFWQDLFDANDFFLLVHRDPVEIAISLKNRNGIPTSVSYYLTEKYLEHAIQAVKERQHFIVSYEELIDRPIQSTKNIIAAINSTGQQLSIPEDRKLSEYSISGLYRSRRPECALGFGDSLQNIYDHLNNGKLPQITATKSPIPENVLLYQHSKRFKEYKKMNKVLNHYEERIEKQETCAVSSKAKLGRLVEDIAVTKNQLLSKNQSLVIAQSQQKVLKWKTQRQELAIIQANKQIVTTQSIQKELNLRLEKTRRDSHSLLMQLTELLKISTDLIDRLQLLFTSRTWQVSRRFITFALRPLQFGTRATVLDEIDQDIKKLRQWNSRVNLNERYNPTESLQTKSTVGIISDSMDQKIDRSPLGAETNVINPSIFCSGNKTHTVKVGLVVTEDSETTSAGDFYTAKEFATALTDEYGWKCIYLPEHGESTDWYDVSDLDILLVLLDKYDLSKLHGQNRPLIKVAWLRNWIDRWTFRPWFQNFNLVLCTSDIAREFIYEQTGKTSHKFEIATNTKRFHPSKHINPNLQSDYCFTGSYWGAPRQIEFLEPSRIPYKFALYGTGWEHHKKFEKCYLGNLPYDKLHAIYANTKVLIDDANHVTKPWASVNSRVFDALATGTLVITNGIAGAQEIFGDLLPTYTTTKDLEQQLRYFIDHPHDRVKLANKLQQIVAMNHSYTNRAGRFRDILKQELQVKTRVAIKLPTQSVSEAIYCKYFNFGKGLAKALRKLGYSVRLDFMCEWYSAVSIPDDVVIVICGHSRYKSDSSQLNLLWVINLPRQIEADECNEYDNIFVASKLYADQLSTLTDTQVMPLLLCTDPDVFLLKKYQNMLGNVVFVGESRSKNCSILDDAITAGLRPVVVGKGWEGIIDESLIAGEYIENSLLPEFYAYNGVVLCDHRQDLTDLGFISSQVFDAVACGAVPVSADIPGLKDIFGDLVYVYSDGPDELNQQVQKALSENTSIRSQRLKLAQKVAKSHNFDTRAKVIDSIISRA